MIINDMIFGEIEYNYGWVKYTTIEFLRKEFEIALMISGEEDGKFEDGLYEAYQEVTNCWSDIQETLLKIILDYYKDRREELGYNTEFNEQYPEIKSTKELFKYITLVGLNIPYANIYGGRSVGISFDCTWNEENGVGIRLNDEEVIEVGYQDIAI